MSSTHTSPATFTPITTSSERPISRTSQTFVSSISSLASSNLATSASPNTSARPSTSPSPSTSENSTSGSTSLSMSSAPTSTPRSSPPTATASSTGLTSTSTPTSTSAPTSSMSTSTRPTSSPPASSSSPPQSSQSSSTPSTSRQPSTSHSSSTAPSSPSHSSSAPDPTLPSSTPASASPSNNPTTTSKSTGPSSILKTTHLITITNSRGETTTSAPAVVTQIFTSTASDGALVTQTSVVTNPTLSPNSGSSGSNFFRNTGAVAGVFVLVGLAVVAICLWIFFAIRRRRRTQKLERDTAVSASLAAAGFKRTDLDDDDLDYGKHSRVASADLEMAQRSASGLGRSDNGDGFDPYVEYAAASHDARSGGREGGYITGIPPSPTLPFLGLGAYMDEGPFSDSEDSRRDRTISAAGRTSAGSYEPLLAAYAAKALATSSSPEIGNDNRPPTPPPRNPLRMLHGSQPGSPSGTPTFDFNRSSPAVTPTNLRRASSEYSSESADHDDRLHPALMQRIRGGSAGASTNDLRDDEDYSRPVLAVRNMTTLTDASSSVHSLS